MSLRVEVASRVLDGGRPSDLLPSVTLHFDAAEVTVADLIAAAVERQVRENAAKSDEKREQLRRLLNRQYLTEADIEKMAHGGAVRMPSQRDQRSVGHVVDLDAEVARAQSAFERGTYVVLIDGKPAGPLHGKVKLGFESRVVFLRLTPLVGG